MSRKSKWFQERERKRVRKREERWRERRRTELKGERVKPKKADTRGQK